jgi:hypothetical protein
MDDIKEAAGRRKKTIQEARSMAMTRKDFRRWTEDPTLKGKRGRRRRRRRRRRRSKLLFNFFTLIYFRY